MKIIAFVIIVGALLASCGNKGSKSVDNSAGDVAAYYCQDSIEKHFKFFKDESASFDSESQEFEDAIMKLQEEGQMLVNNLQIQQQAGALSQIQIAQKNRAIEAVGKKIEILQQTDGVRLEKKREELNKLLMEKMEGYAKEYSEKNGYTMLFAWVSGGQILYIDKSKDVTMDFIKYMNEQEKK